MKSEREKLYEKLEILGNGDCAKGEALLTAIIDRITHARTKHPVYASGAGHAMDVVLSEVQEMKHEIFVTYNDERAQDECLDVIATAIRFKNEEWKND